MIESTIHPTAIVEQGVAISSGVSIWSHTHIRGPDTWIGDETIIGEKVYIAYGVRIGKRVKVNAMVYVCTAITIEDGVMIAAGVVFTNDRYPRSTSPGLLRMLPSEPDANTLPTVVREGATIGAGAVIGPDLEIGRYAMVGMGSVVTKDVAAFALVAGNPARQIGFVCMCGRRLMETDDRVLVCEECQRQYKSVGGAIQFLHGRGS